MTLDFPVYSPMSGIDVLADWNIQAPRGDLQTVLAQPYKIAVLPALCTDPANYAYQPGLEPALSQFDLVIASDIEALSPEDLWQWKDRTGIPVLKAALGCITLDQLPDRYNMVYRPWWAYNLMRMNQYQDTSSTSKPFLFDVLLGARKPHRDFIMLSLQRHPKLMSQCLLSYRDIFNTGQIFDQLTDAVAKHFDEELQWPYVSENINPAWEVAPELTKSISPFVPYDFYRNSWFSVIAESHPVGRKFFLTEKTTKCLFAGRLFVAFAIPEFLHTMRTLGFETFGSVIDESYDYEQLDVRRYSMAFSQMLSLAQQDPVKVYKKIQPILDHNRDRLCRLQQETDAAMQEMLSVIRN